MTLADILEPAATVIAHSELKGLEIGAGVGASLCLPCLYIKPSVVNSSEEPPLVAVAKCAGAGAIIGCVAVAALTTVKMTRLSKDEIVSRAEKLRRNESQKQLDKVAMGGAGVGLALVGLRFSEIAKAEGVRIDKVVCTKSGAWEVFCFGILGATVAVGAVTCGKIVAEMIKKKGDDLGDIEGAKELVDEVAEEAVKATEEAEEAVKEVVDGINSSVVDPAQ